MKRLLYHLKTPETKLISSSGNKEGKRTDRSATNKPRGNCTSVDHPACIWSDFKCLAASWPFLSPGRGRVLPAHQSILGFATFAAEPQLTAPHGVWSHHCHLERDFAAGTENFTPAQHQLRAQDTFTAPHLWQGGL